MKKLNRFEKVKIIMDISNEYKLNITTVMFILATATDKALNKLVTEFEKEYPQIN